MESEPLLQFVLFVVLLVISALVSGSETAFFSLSELDIERLRDLGNKRSKRVVKLRSDPRRLLIVILTANTFVNVAAATIAALATARFCTAYTLPHSLGIFIEVVLVTLVLLVVSELTPKIIAVKNAETFSLRISLFIQFLAYLLFPLTIILGFISKSVSKAFGVKLDGLAYSEEELKMLVEVGSEEGTLQEDERQMIHSIFEFGETQVKEVMVPRMDMICVEKNISLRDLIDTIKSEGHTRIPLYDGRVDNIRGIIHAKDLLPYLKRKDPKVELESLARPAIFVPESKLINEMLKEFQAQKTHMAIVVDEYGGTVGLVTLEDVIEEIVGEIQDEYDVEPPLIKKLDETTWVTDAKIDIDELNEALELQLPSEEGYETLGGFLLDIMGYLPQQKEEVEYKGIVFIIERVIKRRIKKVKIIKAGVQEEEESH